MQARPARGLLYFLQQVADPRGRQGQRHPLTAMLAASVCAVLCGARGFDAIAQWIHLQDLSFWHQLGGKRRPPCANAFRYLLNVVDPRILEEVLLQWVTEGLGLQWEAEGLQAVSLDGKTLCGSFSRYRRATHVLAALDQATGCVLSQHAVPEETNEAKTALELLKGLVLEGRVIVGDAMFCQREICQEIRDRGGHFLFVVKENQPQLLRDVRSAFSDERAFSPLRTAGTL